MIRINLLAARKRAPEPSLFTTQKVPLLCSLVLVLTALGLGWRYWSVRQQSALLDQEIQRAQQEAQSLRTVLEQVKQFETRRTQLQQRVALIEELRDGQGGPVHLLDEVSRAVPDRLWLTEMKQDADGLRIDGRTTSLTALSDFVGNLEASGYFARPVEIIDSQAEASAQAAQAGLDVVKFTVRVQFVLPGAKPKPAPQPGA
jgi:type IV pilus assembly protein PilN